MNRNRHALLIGINKYRYNTVDHPHDPYALKALKYAVNDIKDLSEALMNRGFYTHVLPDDMATKKNIREIFENKRLNPQAPVMNPEDLFLFFFSGHGFMQTIRSAMRRVSTASDAADAVGAVET